MPTDNDQPDKLATGCEAIEPDEWEGTLKEMYISISNAKDVSSGVQDKISLLLTPCAVAEKDKSDKSEGENKTPLLNALDEVLAEIDDLNSQLITLKHRIRV